MDVIKILEEEFGDIERKEIDVDKLSKRQQRKYNRELKELQQKYYSPYKTFMDENECKNFDNLYYKYRTKYVK